MDMLTAIHDHQARNKVLGDQLAAALPVGAVLYWNHQGNVNLPQSGEILRVSNSGVDSFSWQVRNHKTGNTVDVPWYFLDPRVLTNIQV